MGKQQNIVVTKRRAIEILTEIRDGIEEPSKSRPLIDAINVALDEIGKCRACLGAKIEAVPPRTPGAVVKKIGPKTYYVRPCSVCRGAGKHFEGKCGSCGKTFEFTSKQLTDGACEPCEALMHKAGVLVK